MSTSSASGLISAWRRILTWCASRTRRETIRLKPAACPGRPAQVWHARCCSFWFLDIWIVQSTGVKTLINVGWQWPEPVLWCSTEPWKPPPASLPSPALLKVKWTWRLQVCKCLFSEQCWRFCHRRVNGANSSWDHGVSAYRPEGAVWLPHTLRQERRRRGPGERHCPLGRLEFTCQQRVTHTNTHTHTHVWPHLFTKWYSPFSTDFPELQAFFLVFMFLMCISHTQRPDSVWYYQPLLQVWFWLSLQ